MSDTPTLSRATSSREPLPPLSHTSNRRSASVTPIVRSGNSIPISSLREDFVARVDVPKTYVSTGDGKKYTVTLESASSIPLSQLQSCYNMIKRTSGAMYVAAYGRWSPRQKRREMAHTDMRYLIVQSENHVSGRQPASRFEGFLSFMLTDEGDDPVIYCYELHLAETARRGGLGSWLMSLMEAFGRRFELEKAMLTVFHANRAAIAFYKKHGYVEDQLSPKRQVMRNGRIRQQPYMILSKFIGHVPVDTDAVTKPRE